jgi:hypothetical protein
MSLAELQRLLKEIETMMENDVASIRNKYKKLQVHRRPSAGAFGLQNINLLGGTDRCVVEKEEKRIEKPLNACTIAQKKKKKKKKTSTKYQVV